jgi:hypothetical protein
VYRRPKTRVYDYNRVTITKNTTRMTIATITRYIAWLIAFPLSGLVNKVMDHTTLRQSISTQMVTRRTKAGEMVELRPRAGPEVIVRTTTHRKAGPAAHVA